MNSHRRTSSLTKLFELENLKNSPPPRPRRSSLRNDIFLETINLEEEIKKAKKQAIREFIFYNTWVSIACLYIYGCMPRGDNGIENWGEWSSTFLILQCTMPFLWAFRSADKFFIIIYSKHSFKFLCGWIFWMNYGFWSSFMNLGSISTKTLEDPRTTPLQFIFILLNLLGYIWLFARYFLHLETFRKKIYFLSIIILLGGFFIIESFNLYHTNYDIHLHHYMFGLVILLTSNQDSNFDKWGFIIGHCLYIDGISRYGFDSPWEKF